MSALPATRPLRLLPPAAPLERGAEPPLLTCEMAAERARRAWLAAHRGTASAAECTAMALEALEDGALLEVAGLRSGYELCLEVLIMAGAVEEAGDAIDALRDRGGIAASRPLLIAAAAYDAELALRAGDVIGAERSARQALEVAGAEPALAATGPTAVLISALAERGAFDEAHDLLRATPSASTALLHARARLHNAEGQFERAYADACDVGSRRTRQRRTNPAGDSWRSTAALALAHLGRRAEAVALAETELVLATGFGAPDPIARALAARAVAEPDDHRREALARQALERLGANSPALESTRLHIELGHALARNGHRTEARVPLGQALATADAAGASLLAGRARRELVATGLRPRRAAQTGPDSLTPRQRQICELAAAGQSNRAIATQLFLTNKTVETHLATAYRKLGVTTRTDLKGIGV